ncbi:butyrophilin-like protein 1 isoform X10 [Takifugu flavidus]|uniref:butyrophilin-like protein 1 isoform X10 n=1 Tax=Takifugu flavidus TaxID=433684 RepID=UPI002544CE5A|nr:butyrophilin-like protein 1 isoform X10 [Takifugu flavidus]
MLRHSSCRRVRVCVRVRGRRLHPAEAYQIICGTRTSACEATWLRLRGPGLVPGGPAAPPEPVIVAVTPEQQQLRLRCEGVRVTLLFDPPEPTRIRMVVKEDSEVVLNCSASGSVTDQIFDWKKDKNVEVFIYSKGITYGSDWAGQSPQFVGRVAHFPEALDLGNASIRIKKAEVRDSGIYTCTFPHPAPVLRSEISLVVECILKVRPPGEGACSEPNIRIVDGGPDRALLQCEVKGAHPRPAVQWQDSSGRVLPALETESEERDGRFYVTVRANVSRSDDYSCVVTPKEACRQNEARTLKLLTSPPLTTAHLIQTSGWVVWRTRHLGLIDGSDCPPQVLLVTDVFERSAAAGADVAVIIPENIPISYSQLSATDGLHPPGPELLLKMSPTSPHV